MTNIIIKVENMTCSGCEARIENKLKTKDGITEVKATYTKGIVNVSFEENKIDKQKIISEIEKLNYNVVENEDNNKKKENFKLLGILIVLFVLYLIIKNTVGFYFIPKIDQSMSYGMLFVVGIITSLHCMAMCGGINISQCVVNKEGKSSKGIKDKLQPSFLYNLGRVISYTVIGGIVGLIGSVFAITTFAQGIIQMFAGTLILIMGIKMLNIVPVLNKFSFKKPKFIANSLYSNNKKRGPFIIGLLNGLMPCGPLQTMQLYALGTGSFIAGATSMLLFSLGTVPLMFGLGAISTLISNKSTKMMMKISAIIIMILGFNMASRGMLLSGIDVNFIDNNTSTIYNSDKDSLNNTIENNTSDLNITSTSNVQEIHSTINSTSSYPIITVKAGTPVKWTISAEKKYLNGCNNEISIPKYKINQELNVGDTIIEFTPTEVGNFAYSCWMGMIRGSIKVVSNNASPQNQTQNQINTTSQNDDNIDSTGLPSCCSGY